MKTEKMIWDYLNNKLNNPYGTAALMGNLFAESSFNPMLANNIKKRGLTNAEYTALVDTGAYNNFVKDGIAYGLAQWCYHTRKQGLLDIARERKISIGDLNLQLDYLWIELQKYTTVIKALFEAKSIREASDIVLTRYERPANQSEAVKIKRAKIGQEYFDKYNVTQPVISIKKDIAKMIISELQKALGN